MAVYMIATIKDGKTLKGVRLLDVSDGSMLDVDVEQLKPVIGAGKINVVNLCLDKGNLKGVGGAIERYGVVGVSQSCTVLGCYRDGEKATGYKVADCNGLVRRFSVEDTVKIADSIGITNGKVLDKGNGRYVSAIEGEYPVIPSANAPKSGSQTKQPTKPTVPTKATMSDREMAEKVQAAKDRINATKSDRRDPCDGCSNGVCEQCDYGYKPRETRIALYGQKKAAFKKEQAEKEAAKQKRITEAPQKIKLKDGIIVDSETEKPLCEQGELRFSYIHYYKAGKMVLASKEKRAYDRSRQIYYYNVEKDEFKPVLPLLNDIDKVTKITGGLLITYMSTGGYGQFNSSWFGIYNEAEDKFSEGRASNNIISTKIKEIDHDNNGRVIVYDVTPSKIGAFSKPNAQLNMYEISLKNMDVTNLGSVVSDESIKKFDWVSFNGRQIDKIDVCMRAGNTLSVITDIGPWSMRVTDEDRKYLDYWNIYTGYKVDAGKSIKIINLSDEEVPMQVIETLTADRGSVVKVVL